MHPFRSHRPPRQAFLVAVLVSVLTLGVAAALEPGPLEDLRPWSLDAGGGPIGAPGISLRGTIGQTDAGTLSAPGIQLDGGFWSAGFFATGVADEPRTRPETHRLLPAAPNPFNPSTNLRFVLVRPAPVRLEILDVRGRLVRVLLDETLSAGEHERRWNGRDDRGGAVASGVYYLRMLTPHFVDTQKLALLK